MRLILHPWRAPSLLNNESVRRALPFHPLNDSVASYLRRVGAFGTLINSSSLSLFDYMECKFEFERQHTRINTRLENDH